MICHCLQFNNSCKHIFLSNYNFRPSFLWSNIYRNERKKSCQGKELTFISARMAAGRVDFITERKIKGEKSIVLYMEIHIQKHVKSS